jgi:hypothetical protein
LIETPATDAAERKAANANTATVTLPAANR